MGSRPRRIVVRVESVGYYGVPDSDTSLGGLANDSLDRATASFRRT